MQEQNVLKKDTETISKMFNGIAGEYDMLNHLLSFNIDKIWRKGMSSHLLKQANLTNERKFSVLDIACGTGDSAISLFKCGFEVTGIDISKNMLEIAVKKNSKLIERKNEKKTVSVPNYILAGAESIPFPDNSFEAVTISFGIRNFNNRDKCLEEIYRVIKPGGSLAVLEFAKPKNRVIRWGYNLYFNNILPWIGGIVSKNRAAYKYLANSVEQFPMFEEFANEISRAGFKDCRYKKYSLGIAVLYTGKK